MGLRMYYRYRHNRYQLWRTASVVFFQLSFAFLIPAFLKKMNQPEFYFTYFWPLKFDYLFPSTVDYLTQSGGRLGVFMVFWGAAAFFVASLLTGVGLLFAFHPEIPAQGIWLLAVCAAFVGAVVELFSRKIDDNFSITASVAIVVWGLRHFLGV